MIDNNKFLHWLTLEEGKPVKFAALVYLIGKALHPGDDEEAAFRVACVNLDADLQKVMQDGSLMVITSSGFDRRRLAHSDTLQSAELIPDSDLELLLNARGIGLRLIPSVNDGPVYWTLQNAAIAIQKQESWNDDARLIFQNKLCKAASRGDLVMRDPLTDLPDESGMVLDTVNTVTPDDVNDWLKRQGAVYTWKIASLESSQVSEKYVCGPESGSPKSDEQSVAAIPTEIDHKKIVAQTSANGPRLSVSKSALVEQHKHEWPTVGRDIQDASSNGLSQAAKAGQRDWYEDSALQWARSRNKLIPQKGNESTLTKVMNDLPGRKYFSGD